MDNAQHLYHGCRVLQNLSDMSNANWDIHIADIADPVMDMALPCRSQLDTELQTRHCASRTLPQEMKTKSPSVQPMCLYFPVVYLLGVSCI